MLESYTALVFIFKNKNTQRTSRCEHALGVTFLTHIIGECTHGGRSGREQPFGFQPWGYSQG